VRIESDRLFREVIEVNKGHAIKRITNMRQAARDKNDTPRAPRAIGSIARESRVIQEGFEITTRFLVVSARACTRNEKKGPIGPPYSCYASPAARCAMQQRHGCIRSSTCNNAIVRTAGNNWAIYEPGGLALRMYDYAVSVAWHALREPAVTRPRRSAAPPRTLVIIHAATVFPSPGLIVKITLGIRREDIGSGASEML